MDDDELRPTGVRVTARVGDWCQSRSGGQVWPWDPRVEDIKAVDLAYGLREPRYLSQTKGRVITVAQHCLLASLLVEDGHELKALLHDAHEAVFKDLPPQIKNVPGMELYREGAERYQRLINVWAGVFPDSHHHPAVKRVDRRLLATERRDQMAPPPAPWQGLPEPFEFVITPMDPEEAAEQWLVRFHELTGGKHAAG